LLRGSAGAGWLVPAGRTDRDAVPDTGPGRDDRRIPELAAQAADGDRDGVGERVGVLVPHLLEHPNCARCPGTVWLLAASIVLTVAVSTAATAATRCPVGTGCPVDTAKLSLTGVQFGQAVVAILAVLGISRVPR
jgi:hypothetical protein